MNSRERLLCVLEGGTPDMVPVSHLSRRISVLLF